MPSRAAQEYIPLQRIGRTAERTESEHAVTGSQAERATVQKDSSDNCPDSRLPLRVLLVEDSALLVQRISELVNTLPFVRLLGNVSTEAAALERLDAGGIDAIILDLQLHTGNGFGVLKALRKSGGPISVIVFTNFAIAAYRDSALALGAAHFLDKSRDYDQLPTVLRQISDLTH